MHCTRLITAGKRTAPLLLGFAILALLVYGSSLSHPFISRDDPTLITENPIVKHFTPSMVWRAFTSYDPELYVPLTLMSYQFDHAIGGLNPFVFHFTNLLLHILNALMVAWLGTLLLKNRLVGIVAGLLFLVHPLNVEAVVWASSRKDVLSAFFALASLVSYTLFCLCLCGAETFLPHKDRDRTGWWGRSFLQWLSLGFFLLALLSKVSVATLPLLLFLIDWYEGRKFNRSTFLEKVPFFALSLFFIGIALYGKSAVSVKVSDVELLLLGMKSTTFYLQKVLWPLQLSVIYPQTTPISILRAEFWLPAVILLALLILAIARKNNRILAFGLLFFLLALLPSFSNVVKGSDVLFASDRYAYMGSIGIFFVCSWALWQLCQHLFSPYASATFFIVIALALTTRAQTSVWENSETLLRHAVSVAPKSASPRIQLATVLVYEMQRPDDAVQELSGALALGPNTKAHIVIAAAYQQKKELHRALEEYRKALAIAPNRADAHFGYATILADLGRIDDATREYERAIELDWQYNVAYNNLGTIYLDQGRYVEAEQLLKEMLAQRPADKVARRNLGLAYQRQKRIPEAFREFQTAASLDPDYADAHASASVALLLLGRSAEAGREAERALELDPENEAARTVVGTLRESGFLK